MEENQELKLGSAEAAVRSCVSLIAAVSGQREAVTAYWLDLYYQVRLLYEKEKSPPRKCDCLRKEEAEAFLLEMLRDRLPQEEQQAEAEQKSPKAEQKAPKEEQKAPKAERKPRKTAQTPKAEKKAGDGTSVPAKAAAFKRDVVERLGRARERGLTCAEIAAAAGSDYIDSNHIFSILGGQKLGIDVYRGVAAGLDRLGL